MRRLLLFLTTLTLLFTMRFPGSLAEETGIGQLEGGANLLEYGAIVLNGYLNGTPAFVPSNYCKCFVIPVTGGKTYTFRRKNPCSRLVASFDTAVSSAEHRTFGYVSGSVDEGMDLTRITVTVPMNCSYVYIYFYRSQEDESYEKAIEGAVFTEGDGITPVPSRHAADDPDAPGYSWTTRRKVYGVEFDTEAESPACTRIADAVGVTDFDNVFPWSEMRRCAVTVKNGKKTVIYEGEPGYAVDGSAGNVMVEIPAFYVCRERVGTTERWLITGSPCSGFELHPWFLEPDGTPVTHRYYGAYKATDSHDGVFSVSGAQPYSGEGRKPDYLAGKFRTAGFHRNTIQAVSALQYLFVIEYATRDSQSVFNGSTYNLYFYLGMYSTCEIVRGITVEDGLSTLKLDRGSTYSGNSLLFCSPGMQVYIGTAQTGGTVRSIVALSDDGESIYVTVDGDPIVPEEGLSLAGIRQVTGRTDSLTEPTGYAPGMDSHVASFRYRGIEDPWGNVWEVLDGLKIRNGVWYFTSSPKVTAISKMTALSYAAPMVAASDHDPFNWIQRLGYDPDHPIYALPELLCTDDGTAADIRTDSGVTVREGVILRGGKYYGDAFYSGTDAGVEMFFAFGGGWDHHENAGLFCMRGLTSVFWLYGERLTY